MKKKENQNIQHLTTCYMHRSKGSTISSSTKSQRQNKLRGNNCCSLKNNPGNVKYREFSAALETNLTAPARDSKNNKKKCTGGGGDITSTTTNLDRPTTSTTSSITTSSTTTPAEMNKLHQAKSFPMEVYKMLAVLEDLGLSRQICSWNPHGRSFQIHNNVKFVKFILPKFFRSIQMRTFKKQLSVYGFRRVLQNSEDYGSYYHDRFLRGKPFSCSDIVSTCKKRRRKMKTSAASIHDDDDVVEEPLFYALPYLPFLLPGHRYDCSIEIFGDDHNIEAFFREVQDDHKRSCEVIKMKHLKEESTRVGVIPPKSKARDYYFMPPPVDASSTIEPIHHMATPEATMSSEQKACFVKFCQELESILSEDHVGNDVSNAPLASSITTKKHQRNASPSPYLRKMNKTVTRTRTKEHHDLSVSRITAAVVVSPIPSIEQQHDVQRHDINDQFLWDTFNVVALY